MTRQTRANLLLVAVACAWGVSVVAQTVGAYFLDAFTFNAARFFLGGALLFPLAWRGFQKQTRKQTIRTLISATCGGGVLFLASLFQQLGAERVTNPGRIGFLTGLYTVLTPIFYAVFFGKRSQRRIWIAAAVALLGLYFLCFDRADGFSVGFGDALLLLGAVFWAWHIITVGEFENGQDPFLFASLQFFACGGFHLLLSLLLDRFTFSGIRAGAWCILFSGVVSTAFGFTAQVIGQRMSPSPSRAAVILTSESLFSLLGGVLWNLLPIARRYPVDADLGQFGLLGAALMLGAILLAGYRTNTEKELDKYPQGVYNRDSKEKGAERWKRWTVTPLVRKRPNGRLRKRKG